MVININLTFVVYFSINKTEIDEVNGTIIYDIHLHGENGT